METLRLVPVFGYSTYNQHGHHSLAAMRTSIPSLNVYLVYTGGKDDVRGVYASYFRNSRLRNFKQKHAPDTLRQTCTIFYIILPCIKVFFWYFDIFFSSSRGSSLVLSAPWHAVSSPQHHGASVGPGRPPWHVLWGFKVGRPHGEALRARGAIQAPANPRTGWNNVRRLTWYLGFWMSSMSSDITSWWKIFDTNMPDMRPLLTQKIHLHDLQRMWSLLTHMATRWLGLFNCDPQMYEYDYVQGEFCSCVLKLEFFFQDSETPNNSTQQDCCTSMM